MGLKKVMEFVMEIDVAKGYLNSLKKYPLLSADEEIALAKRIKSGDKEAFNLLVNSNLRLVVSVAGRFNKGAFCIMDLIQEGNLGLMIAAKKFDPAFGTRFSTYAYRWIVQRIMKFISANSSPILLPVHRETLLRRIQKFQNIFFQQNGREATVKELALFAGISEERLNDVLETSYTVASLDVEVADEGKTVSLGDIIPDTAFSPEELAIREDSKSCVNFFMDSLTGIEKSVLRHRYNFDYDLHSKSLREVGRIVGLSQEAVRQAELRAKKHLKSAMESVFAV